MRTTRISPTRARVDFPQSEINLPPKNRFNLGVNYSGSRLLGNLAVSYQDEAYWQDVLDAAIGHHRRLHAGEPHRRREVRHAHPDA